MTLLSALRTWVEAPDRLDREGAEQDVVEAFAEVARARALYAAPVSLGDRVVAHLNGEEVTGEVVEVVFRGEVWVGVLDDATGFVEEVRGEDVALTSYDFVGRGKT